MEKRHINQVIEENLCNEYTFYTNSLTDHCDTSTEPQRILIFPAPTPLFSPESDFANLVFSLSHVSSTLTPAVLHLIVVRHLTHAGGNGQVNKNRSEKRKEGDGV